MVDVVDSIVAELIVRDVDKYEAGFDRATKAHERFLASTGKLQRQTFDLGAEGRKYKAGADAIAKGQEQADERVTRSRKKRAADAKVSDEAEVASAKKAAKEREAAAKAAAKAEADAKKQAVRAERDHQTAVARVREQEIAATRRQRQELSKLRDAERQASNQAKASSFLAPLGSRGLSGSSARSSANVFRTAEVAVQAETEAQVSARLRAAVDKGVASATVKAGTGTNLGRTVPREEGGRAFIGATTIGAGVAAEATAKVAAEKEVNHLLADQAALQSRLTGARGKDRDIIREQLAELRLIGQLQRAGLRDEEIALRLEQRRLSVEQQRARSTKADFLASANTVGRGAVVAGAGVLAAGAVGVAVIQSALDYGKALKNVSDQLGITTDDLQAYQKLARDAGVSQDQLSSAFGQFANNLGRAKQGEEEQIAAFKALRINIKQFASAGDALPTVIDRISQIADPAQRAAIETRLFGESGRRLDTLLAGGADRVTDLSVALQKTGKALSQAEIQRLDDTARKMADLKNELQVEFAQVVTSNADSIVRLANSLFTLTSSIVQFLASKPEAVPALMGAIAGAKVGGLPGAAIGAVVGYGTGNFAREAAENPKNAGSNFNLRTRTLTEYDPQGNVISRRPIPKMSPETRGLRIQIDDGSGKLRDVQRDANGNPILPGSAPSGNPRVQGGSPNMAAIRRLGANRGPRGKSAQQLEKEADQRQRRADDELFRVSEDYLQAQRQITASAERRYEIDKALTGAAYQHRLKEIDREVTEKQIDASRAKGLKAAEKLAYEENLAVLALQNRVRIESDANALRQQMLDAEAEMLSAQEQLADSSSERKEIAARRLAAERRAETASLNAIINSADPSVSEGDRSLARDRLGSQDTRFGAQAARDARANESPLEAYRRNLNRTPGQITDSVESYVVEELDAVHDAITGAIQKAIGVKDPLLQGLLDLLIDQVVMKPLLAALDKAKGEGGGGLGGFIQGIASIFGGSKVGGTRAAGGNIVAGVPYLVGEHGPEPVVFGASGRVFPNGALPSIGARGGAMALHQTVNIDASGVNPAGYTASILGIVRRETSAAIQQSGRAVLAATPARMQKLSDLGS